MPSLGIELTPPEVKVPITQDSWPLTTTTYCSATMDYGFLCQAKLQIFKSKCRRKLLQQMYMYFLTGNPWIEVPTKK